MFEFEKQKPMLFFKISRPSLGPMQPPVQRVHISLRELKQSEREADLSPFTTEVTNELIYT